MVSVTSDIAANSSLQTAPRAKADAPPSNDSFGSLVDSNTTAAANNNDRAPDRTQDRAPDRSQDAAPAPAPQASASERRDPPPRRDDAPAAEKAQPRNAKADKPECNDVAERNDAVDRDDVTTDQTSAEKPAEGGATKSKKTKTADKGEESKAADSPSSGDAAATDSTDAQAAGSQPGVEIADAIAAAIAVPVVPAAAPAPAPAAANAGSQGGPLAIAAAAIAASTAVTDAAAVPTPAAAGTDTTKIAAVDGKPADVTTADVKAAGAEAIAKVGADTKAVETTAQAAAMAVPAPRPATAKTTAAAKTSATGEVTASSDEPDAPADMTDAPVVNATAAPVASDTEQAAATKPAVQNAHAETIVKPDGAQTPSAAAAHLHPVSQHDGTPGQTGTQTLGAQATATLQPAVQAPLTPSQPSFTVTAATPSATVPLSGLTMEIAASVRSGKTRFEIRLDPADLGRIDVRIDVDRNGQVTSHLTVEKPETLSMLRQDAPQLQRALNDAGLSTGNGGLQFSLRDQSSQGQNGNQSNPNTHRLILTEDETVPATVAGSYGRMLSASGGVDIRI